MKQRSTTPVSKGKAVRGASFVFVALALMLVPTQFTPKVSADPYDDQIRAIQKEISEYQAQAQSLSKEADTLQNKLEILTKEKDIIQSQIVASDAKKNKLEQDIAANKQKIANNRDALGETLADVYLDDSISPLEMLASSASIGDYVDKQEYRAEIRDNLTGTINEIEKLKKELETQKIAVERELADQQTQHKVLADKEAERQAVLDATKGKEAAYNKLSSDRQSQVNYLREQQRIAFAAISPGASSSPTGYAINYRSWSGNVRCGGGYRYCNYALDSYVQDDWGLGLTGECVHYTADWLARNGYYIPYGAFAPGRGGGNANQWIGTATRGGFGQVVSSPQRGDVAYMAVPGVGHVGIVEENYNNGWVKVSQYNFATNGGVGYSTMDLQITNATSFLRFSR